MNKIQNGLILIGVGIVMNVIGRSILSATGGTPTPIIATIMVIWMIASVVLVVFGLFRLVAGLINKSRASKMK